MMLSFLFHTHNIPAEIDPQVLKKEFPAGIGLSRTLSASQKADLCAAVPAVLYDSELTVDTVTAADVTAAFSEAAALGAKTVLLRAGKSCDRGRDESVFVPALKEYRRLAEEKGLRLLLTNRKEFDAGLFMSSEKFIRLADVSGVRIAHDLGFSHAQASALEDFYDFGDRTELLLISDNYGREARNNPDWCTQEMMIPGEMRQPGYGTLPIVGIMRLVRKTRPEMPVFINGTRYRDADLPLVMLETKTLLGGRVFISPAMARKGRNAEGRLLI